MQLDLFNTQKELLDMRFWNAVRYLSQNLDQKRKEQHFREENFKDNKQTVLFK